MEILNNFKDLFLSVWNKGIIGVDFIQILVGLAIFFVFLDIISNFLRISLLIRPLKIKNIKNIPKPIRI